MSGGTTRIASARGGLDEARAGEVQEFLAREGGLTQEVARRWLGELVCLSLEDDEVTGVGAARPASVGLIGGRPFWIYQSVLAPHGEEHWEALFNLAFKVLAEEFEEPDGPYIGTCVLLDDPGQMRKLPEAVWPETELMFAGYLDDGRQVRIRYFWGAAIAPGLPNSPSLEETRSHEYPLEDRYRIMSLDESPEVGPDDVIRFWEREGSLEEPAEGARRAGEVSLVAVDRDGEVAAVSSLYLRTNEQLRAEMWHYRTFVGAEHRMSNLAAQLIFGNRDNLEHRFVTGEDTRAPGVLFELENEGVAAYFNKALWLPADFTFIGENQLGDPVRVHWFPGARVPGP
jgi:hypothetical protein